MTTKFARDVWIVMDFETSNQNRYTCKLDRLCVLMLDMNTGKTITETEFNFRGDTQTWHLPELRDIMHLPTPKVAHNAAFELYLMETRLKIPINGTLHDTMLMTKHWRNDLPAYDLKSLSWWLLGDLYLPLTKLREWIHQHNLTGEDDIEFDMTRCPDKLVHNYCTHDVRMTAALATMMWPHVKENYAYQQDTEIIRLNSKMEADGITADLDFYREFIRLGTRRVKRNVHTAAVDFGLPSGSKKKPTGTALRSHLGKMGERRRTRTGLVCTNEVVLRDHKDSVGVRAVLRVRRDQKQVNTYAKNVIAVSDEHGQFHPNLRQSAAITRRWRSSGFFGTNGVVTRGNTQNFPRGPGIRTGIIVPPGFWFVKFDLSSIEARLGAHAMSVFLNERWFCEQYTTNPKFNIYIYVASMCTGKEVKKHTNVYEAYKHGCLGKQYGVGEEQFYKTLHDKFELPYTLDDCAQIYRRIDSEFPQFKRLQRAVSGIVTEQGYITDDFGAIYYVPEAERYKGVNYYCQGCAGNVFKWWWLQCDPLLRDSPGDYFFNVVHDEFDGAIHKDKGSKTRVQAYLDTLKGLDLFDLPLTAEASELCSNWGEAG